MYLLYLTLQSYTYLILEMILYTTSLRNIYAFPFKCFGYYPIHSKCFEYEQRGFVTLCVYSHGNIESIIIK